MVATALGAGCVTGGTGPSSSVDLASASWSWETTRAPASASWSLETTRASHSCFADHGRRRQPELPTINIRYTYKSNFDRTPAGRLGNDGNQPRRTLPNLTCSDLWMCSIERLRVQSDHVPTACGTSLPANYHIPALLTARPYNRHEDGHTHVFGKTVGQRQKNSIQIFVCPGSP